MTNPESDIKQMNIKWRTLIGVLFGVLISVLSASIVLGATSTSFNLEGILNQGGGFSTSSGFRSEGSIGDGVGTGISTSTSFILKGGFLNFLQPAAPAAPAPTPTPTPTPSPGSGGGGGGGTGFILPPIIREGPIPEGIINACDFSGDGRCNIIDLSILLFYYQREDEPALRFDLNRKGIVDFPDISIMMFYWTG